MVEYITKIRTTNGDLPVDYKSLANKPDETLLETESKELIEAINEVNQKAKDAKIMDSELSETSENGVQNKIITKELNSVKNSIPIKISELDNDEGYLTSVPSEYITEDELSAKGYLTQHQSLDDYAKKTEIPTTAAQVGADPSGTAGNKVSEHNTSTTSHNDIRLLIEELTARFNALANSDDDTLDQMAEVVAYIKNNKSLIDSITTGKVNVDDIINDLTTNVSDKPLSAAQGVVLKGLIDDLTLVVNGINIPTKVSELDNDKGYLTSVPSEYITESELTAKGYATTDQVSELYDEIVDYIFPKTFGAVGDGVEDDTQAIQNAINSVNVGIVYFPSGTYAISSPIEIPNRVSLELSPNATIKAIAPMDYMIKVTRDAYESHEQFISGGIIDGNALSKIGITNSWIARLKIADIIIKNNIEYNLYLDGGYEFTIDTVKIDNTTVRNDDWTGEHLLNSCGVYVGVSDSILNNIVIKNNNIGLITGGGNNKYTSIHVWSNVKEVIDNNSIAFDVRNSSIFLQCTADSMKVGWNVADYCRLTVDKCFFYASPSKYVTSDVYAIKGSNLTKRIEVTNSSFMSIDESTTLHLFENGKQITFFGCNFSDPFYTVSTFKNQERNNVLYYKVSFNNFTLSAGGYAILNANIEGIRGLDMHTVTMVGSNMWKRGVIYSSALSDNKIEIKIYNTRTSDLEMTDVIAFIQVVKNVQGAMNYDGEFVGTMQLDKTAGLIPTIPTKTSQLTNDSGYLTSIPNEYITETELANKKYLTSVPSEYITESELNAKGYATTTQVNQLSNDIADQQTQINYFSTYVTPQMYGAKGDGTTDDTQAFKNALAENSIVFVPKGTYLITDTIDLSNSKSLVSDAGQKATILYGGSNSVVNIGRLSIFRNINITMKNAFSGLVFDTNNYNKTFSTSGLCSRVEHVTVKFNVESPNATLIGITVDSGTDVNNMPKLTGVCFQTYNDIIVDSTSKNYGNGIKMELIEGRPFTEETKNGFPWITHIDFDDIYLECPYTAIKSTVTNTSGAEHFNRINVAHILFNNVYTQFWDSSKTRYFLDLDNFSGYFTKCIAWDYHPFGVAGLKANLIGENVNVSASDCEMEFGVEFLKSCEFTNETNLEFTVEDNPLYFMEKYFKGTVLSNGYDYVDVKIEKGIAKTGINETKIESIAQSVVDDALAGIYFNLMLDEKTQVKVKQRYSNSSQSWEFHGGSDALIIPAKQGVNLIRIRGRNLSTSYKSVFLSNDLNSCVVVGEHDKITVVTDDGDTYLEVDNTANYKYISIPFDHIDTPMTYENMTVTINQIITDSSLSYVSEHINSPNIHVTKEDKENWDSKSTFSGDYNDLTNKPTIPSLSGYAKKTEVPTKTSQLTNDSGFITAEDIPEAQVPDLSGYALKSNAETWTFTLEDGTTVTKKVVLA